MKTAPPTPPQLRRPRGIALVMTVIMLALITILVLGLANLVRNETVSSYSHEERGRALLFANMGVDIVTGVLRQQTADPTKAWVSKPGALIVPDSSGTQPTRLVQQINLHSGIPSSALMQDTSVFQPANLNIQTLTDQTPPTYLISDQPADPANPSGGVVKLSLRWVYVRKDGSYDYTEQPDVTNDSNPVVGRFAYWMDDESSKLNLNTAWKRNPPTGGTGVTNPFSPSHPTSVDLSGIFLLPVGSTSASTSQLTAAAQMADQLHAFITPAGDYSDLASTVSGGRFFNSAREPRKLDNLHGGTAFTTALNAAKFETTFYNHDPNTTFFNEPRMVLTTQQKYAPKDAQGNLLKDSDGTPYFLDILKTENTATTTTANYTDPGIIANLDSTSDPGTNKVNKTMKKLISYLSRQDWPLVTGTSSFQEKYFKTTTSNVRLAQLALNIIEYVRSAESPSTIIEPVRGVMSGTDFIADFFTGQDAFVAGADNTYKGLGRNVFISEVGVWMDSLPQATGANKGRYQCKLIYEMCLPPHYGLTSLDLTNVDGKQFYFYITPVISATAGTAAAGGKAAVPASTLQFFSSSSLAPVSLNGMDLRLDAANIISGDNLNGTVLTPTATQAAYAKVEFTTFVQVPTGSPRPTTFPNIRTAIMLAHGSNGQFHADAPDGAKRLDICPLGSVFPTYVLDSPGVAETAIRSWQTDDPRVNIVTKDWTTKGQVLNTFGHINTNSTLGKSTTTSPKQDTNASGLITDDGLLMPYKKGDTHNPKGIVNSPGELGCIHTGMEVSNAGTGGLPPAAGIPWRTLHLQPNDDAATVVPDWAFMDLFTAPVDAPTLAQGVFAPHSSSAGGRVNMNAQAEPFGNPDASQRPSGSPVLERRDPLIAVLLGVPKNAAGDLLSLTDATTIAHNIYSRTLATKGKTYGYANAYDSPGEVVEMMGVADGGEETEAVVRGIANLITSRGGVFTIYTIGQSLQQTRNHQLVINAEQRQQTMVERYTLPPAAGTAAGTPTQVRFRKVGFQDLTP